MSGGHSRGKEAPAARAREALQEGARQGGARGDLCALPQLVQQHERIRPRIVQHIPALCRQACSRVSGVVPMPLIRQRTHQRLCVNKAP